MKKIIPIIFLLSLITSCAEDSFQNDADLIRLEHLLYWTELVEDYYSIEGKYPFQDVATEAEGILLIKIATDQQRAYLSSGNSTYNEALDNNGSGGFIEKSMAQFTTELEAILGRPIEERYDIQKVPNGSPVGYNYFVTSDGYLIWVTCITCGVTEISTLLLDGFTPTVNIVSDGMKGQVTKALLRQEMIDHPIFKEWIDKPYLKEEYVKSIVLENINDSHKNR